MSVTAKQLVLATSLVESHSKGDGLVLASKMEKATAPILVWLHWYGSHRVPLAAGDLLPGTHASVLESIAYVSMGLGRAALTAIRTQIDLVLSFTYFKDHPIEWTRVTTSGDGFVLRGDVYTYHKTTDKGFASRLAAIEAKANLSLETLYKTLSAHIHGQSPFTVPNSKEIKDLVWSKPKLESVVKIQEQVAEALSNFLMSVHSKEWVDLPPALVAEKQKLLGDKQKEFFAS